jgi:hypothetical protein
MGKTKLEKLGQDHKLTSLQIGSNPEISLGGVVNL